MILELCRLCLFSLTFTFIRRHHFSLLPAALSSRFLVPLLLYGLKLFARFALAFQRFQPFLSVPLPVPPLLLALLKIPLHFTFDLKEYYTILNRACIPVRKIPIIKPQTAPLTRIHCRSFPTLFSTILVKVSLSSLSKFSCTKSPICE